jgi:hypothetical protein
VKKKLVVLTHLVVAVEVVLMVGGHAVVGVAPASAPALASGVQASHHPSIVSCNTKMIRAAYTATENSKQIFPGKELRGHSPNSCIHVSWSDLYIPTYFSEAE